MTPLYFLLCTPRKLSALCEVHAEMNNPKKKQKDFMTIDGVPIKSIPNAPAPKGGVGTPNAFVDQLTFMR